MQIEWTVCYDSGKLWEPDYKGVFFVKDNVPFFAFNKEHTFAVFPLETSGIGAICMPNCDLHVDLPSSWVSFPSPKERLICSESAVFDVKSFYLSSELSDAEREAFMQREANIRKLADADFAFGEYIVRHDGQCGFRGLLGETELWRVTCQGYLYTDMELYKDHFILFGTDGAGGRFYELDLRDGQKVAEIKTNGTNHYVGTGELRYMILCGKQGGVAAVSLDSGKIVDHISLPGTANTYSRLFFHEGSLYATSFEYLYFREHRTRLPVYALMSCIKPGGCSP